MPVLRHVPVIAPLLRRQLCGWKPHLLYPTKWLRNFAGTPVSGMLVYLVSFTPQNGCAILRGPRSPARSRYCASPEASIMRLEAASTLLHKKSYIVNCKSYILHRAQRLIRVNSWTEKSVKMTLLHWALRRAPLHRAASPTAAPNHRRVRVAN